MNFSEFLSLVEVVCILMDIISLTEKLLPKSPSIEKLHERILTFSRHRKEYIQYKQARQKISTFKSGG